jgi:hypothetical protein
MILRRSLGLKKPSLENVSKRKIGRGILAGKASRLVAPIYS